MRTQAFQECFALSNVGTLPWRKGCTRGRKATYSITCCCVTLQVFVCAEEKEWEESDAVDGGMEKE